MKQNDIKLKPKTALMKVDTSTLELSLDSLIFKPTEEPKPEKSVIKIFTKPKPNNNYELF